ncbi:MAG TPA: hypothetical protein VGN72_18675 [Tepidisphaeraceae bacterium]|jgi:hypothetical protein|nr:hypothetical protein [Tepidisphaeraceae bacterium]
MATDYPPATPDQPIVAKPGRYYRNVRYLMALAAVLMGCWFAYDGFIAWPRMNVEYDRVDAEITQKQNNTPNDPALKDLLKQRDGLTKRNNTEIMIQKILAFTLPPAGIALLIWMFHNSRGQYRFDGRTLSVPGHPPIDVGSISAVDRKIWDRKGIAYVEYATADGRIGRARLDDFVYEREPTDAIFEQITNLVDQPVEPGTDGETVVT